MNEVELVVDARAEVAEGPVWHDQALWWLDVLGGAVHRYDPASGRDEAWELGQAVGALVPRRGGGFLLAVRDGFAAWDGPGAALELVAPVELENPGNRMNDGKCDRRGRFWASTMEYSGAAGRGTLYSLDPSLSLSSHVDGLSIGNGLAWSDDDTRLYFIDSLTGGVDLFDFDLAAGAVSNRRRFVDLGYAPGGGMRIPDGMTIDAEGCLWVAVFGGGEIRRYTPEGQLDRVLKLPVSNVTCCSFGGEDLGDLYITTAWHALSDEQRKQQPEAGGVFVARPGVTGTAAQPFGG